MWTVPSIEEDAFHVQCIVSDKHVSLHAYLEDGGWSHRLHQDNQEWVSALQTEVSIHVYNLERRKGGREGGREQGGREGERESRKGGREGGRDILWHSQHTIYPCTHTHVHE